MQFRRAQHTKGGVDNFDGKYDDPNAAVASHNVHYIDCDTICYHARNNLTSQRLDWNIILVKHHRRTFLNNSSLSGPTCVTSMLRPSGAHLNKRHAHAYYAIMRRRLELLCRSQAGDQTCLQTPRCAGRRVNPQCSGYRQVAAPPPLAYP